MACRTASATPTASANANASALVPAAPAKPAPVHLPRDFIARVFGTLRNDQELVTIVWETAIRFPKELMEVYGSYLLPHEMAAVDVLARPRYELTLACTALRTSGLSHELLKAFPFIPEDPHDSITELDALRAYAAYHSIVHETNIHLHGGSPIQTPVWNLDTVRSLLDLNLLTYFRGLNKHLLTWSKIPRPTVDAHMAQSQQAQLVRAWFSTHWDTLQQTAVYANELKLTLVPPEFFSLKARSLYLNSNRLVYLPRCFGAQTQLQALELCSNPLASFPEEICRLASLSQLHISYTGLREIPRSILQLTQLTVLGLSGNRLSQLPPLPPSLRKLAVMENRLSRDALAPYEAILDLGSYWQFDAQGVIFDVRYHSPSSSQSSRTVA